MYIYLSFKTDGISERINNTHNNSSSSKAFFFFYEAASGIFLIYNQNYEKS